MGMRMGDRSDRESRMKVSQPQLGCELSEAVVGVVGINALYRSFIIRNRSHQRFRLLRAANFLVFDCRMMSWSFGQGLLLVIDFRKAH